MRSPELEPNSLQGIRLSRRSLLGGGVKAVGALAAAGLAGGLLEACSSTTTPATTGPSLTDLTYQLSWIKDTEFAGSFLAQNKGFYKNNGLDVTLLAGGADVIVEPIVVSGKALVGSSNADTVAQARANGAPLQIIGVRYQKNPFCMISSAAAPITTPTAMYGKKIGVSSANTTGWNTFLKINNLDVSKIDVVPVQFDPTPLADGQVDGWMGYITDEPGVLQLKGFKTYTFLFAEFGYDIFSDVYETTEDSIANHKAELVSFLKAEREGWQYNLANLAAGTSASMVYAAKEGEAANQQQLENEAQVSLIETPYTTANGLFTMDPSDIASNLATFKVAGIPADASLFNTAILEAL